MRQGDLFGPSIAAGTAATPIDGLAIAQEQLLGWQQRLAAVQAPLFEGLSNALQGDLFSGAATANGAELLNPLQLRPQPLNFWRWPQAPQRGAALYFVTDQPPLLPTPLLLYVGETAQADRRWKGEHDCKSYLAAYGEALHRAGLASQLSIRFWLDVPEAVKARRALEQALIRRWQPPFNKEMRSRWATPFQAESD